MGSLAGKKALVTGAATGIGRATVLTLAHEGAQVGVHYFKSKDHAEQLQQQLVADGVKAEVFQADLSDASQAKHLVERFVQQFGGMDVLVNNAGELLARKTLAEMDIDFFHKVQAVNVDSMVAVTKAALPYLVQAGQAGGASVVNVSSLAGRLAAGKGASAYCAAKGAMLSWTRSMARELGPHGIRVNAVAPGLILGTHFHETYTPKQVIESVVESIPIGRAGDPYDVARAIAFLASEYDGFITGATLDINGGVYGA